MYIPGNSFRDRKYLSPGKERQVLLLTVAWRRRRSAGSVAFRVQDGDDAHGELDDSAGSAGVKRSGNPTRCCRYDFALVFQSTGSEQLRV